MFWKYLQETLTNLQKKLKTVNLSIVNSMIEGSVILTTWHKQSFSLAWIPIEQVITFYLSLFNE